jgi:hypothetical protein
MNLEGDVLFAYVTSGNFDLSDTDKSLWQYTVVHVLTVKHMGRGGGGEGVKT